jgi:hypothetical protein
MVNFLRLRTFPTTHCAFRDGMRIRGRASSVTNQQRVDACGELFGQFRKRKEAAWIMPKGAPPGQPGHRYDRVPITERLADGTAAEVDTSAERGRPSKAHLELIISGAEEHDLPRNYIDGLRRTVTLESSAVRLPRNRSQVRPDQNSLAVAIAPRMSSSNDILHSLASIEHVAKQQGETGGLLNSPSPPLGAERVGVRWGCRV